ncbi:AAA-ATPase At3g50940-like [Macadamia integrifolia]|uniref:AAA-ATPase At3g50940-like n=1 Tax=Macadamia integrifolia TaxID=60698 RepID=UPI001C52F5CA|nr:AAA-ATPase At3g50940-like [Macadamia integrifolia]
MFDFTTIPSTSKVLSVYASVVTSIMIFRTMANQLIPHRTQDYIFSRLQYILAYLISSPQQLMTIVVDEETDFQRNEIFDASQIYLRSKLITHSSSVDRVKVTKTARDKNLLLGFEKDQEIIDFFRGIQLKWKLVYEEHKNDSSRNRYNDEESRWFELSFDKKHKDVVLYSYLSDVVEKSKALIEEKRVVKLYSRGKSINLEHPATFDKLAMDPELKRALIDDLDRFVKRKEFYKRVGKAWKRGYLLYGPPGTGKSSLIAAMANHLRFDIYDIELTGLRNNSGLKDLLVWTTNRSIIVIEDIDCSIEMNDRGQKEGRSSDDNQLLTLSGLLNFIDGLWSSCGDERIIVFTTNYKDRLDPALLRPGRMDMHIHMSYCTPSSFRLLASNYFGICDHRLFKEIERLIEEVEVTPAEVAEELMKSDDVDVNLHGLINFIHRKNKEREGVKVHEKVNDDEERVDRNEGEEGQKEEMLEMKTK